MAGSGAAVCYAELDRRSGQLARLLGRRGFGRHTTVAVVARNRSEWAEITWAAMRSGRTIAPVNHRLHATELAEVLRVAEAEVVVVDETAEPVVRAVAGEVPSLRLVLVLGGGYRPADPRFADYESALADQPVAALPEETLGGRIMFSSGTTGTPKAIRHPAPAVHPAQAPPHLGRYTDLFGLDADTVYLSPAPTYHTAPFRFLVAVTQLGGTVVSLERFDPVAALEAIDRYRVTHAQFVPTMLLRILRLPDAVKRRFDLSSLRVAITGAAPCPHELKVRIMDWWGPVLHELYGASESYGNCHIAPHEVAGHPGSVGRTLRGTIHITDEYGRRLAPGEIGTVWFEGGGDFTYHGDDAKTSASRHPLGWRTVGDTGYLDEDGYLYLTGRRDHVIIRGGVNIHPQEVEDVLLLHPQVADAAVLGESDPEYGQRVKAFVVPTLPAGAEPDPQLGPRLIDYCRSRLAHYKCPSKVVLVEALPRGENGKLYLRELPGAQQASCATGSRSGSRGPSQLRGAAAPR